MQEFVCSHLESKKGVNMEFLHNTVQPQYNEPLYNDFLDLKSNIIDIIEWPPHGS